ncbi:MAG: pentapeptide repeat-containing protein [Desulfopila sp.]
MTDFLPTVGLTLIALTLTGCSTITEEQLIDSGQKPLAAESLYTLVSGKSLHLTAIDFDATIHFGDDQKLTAKSISGETDTGHWDITTDDLLCLDFRTWYYGDLRCYSVYAVPESDTLAFFTGNGARYYTANQLDTTPAELLEVDTTTRRTSYLKEQRNLKAGTAVAESAVEPVQEIITPDPGSAEMKRLLIVTARNCPACDLSGVDLSNGDLVGAKLAGANLAGANLSGTNLRGADLSGANLTGANLPGALLIRADLTRADFSGANLSNADLSAASTQGATFKNALLHGATGIR